ncbi:uncharacterized protein TrAtP1_008018 [Trichoderma atroviride]|uniref:uncharacterized protein n=1 Tax=Hypocrea atroviridis TaxID=63577 RepID=UPI00331D22A6|nr:hypothetical protein TrAtP1_008018 [Trichoderma atroviride]
MKVAWNRTTVETLDLALHEALPKARLVCRDEQYKNKAIIYYTLQKYHAELQKIAKTAEIMQAGFMGFGRDIFRSSPRVKQLAADFKKLFQLFTEIITDEVFAFKEKDIEFLPFDSCVTCSYCRSNIFNRFLTCKHCVRYLPNGEEDAYDVCMECYAMGRSCVCLSGLQWCEQWLWSELTENYETWKATVIAIDGHVDLENSPQPLEITRQRAGKKSLAQICQEALKRRPWKDITKPDREKTPSDSEQGEGDDKPSKKAKRKKKKGEVHRCHVCCHPDYSYRIHLCTNPGCLEGYCYGVLYRAFDLMPQTVMEDEHWQCPKCLGICNCGHCRRAGITQPYMPKNTSLGHDTRRIADDRSVEALVDFRIHNLSWLKAAGEESRSKDSKRMQLLREQADNAKAQDALQQSHVEPRMQPSAVFTANLGESSAINGYGDQSQVLGHDGGNVSNLAFDVSDRHTYKADNVPQDVAAPASVDASADASADAPADASADAPTDAPADAREQESVYSSQYPDPSVFTRQRIGMGYYEQDDTPDKILFDPYQAPSAESIQADESTVPDFVKKTIRAAKRKAKRENDDPDFIVSKSHAKKQRLIPQATDFLDNMDPALFVAETLSAVPDQATAPAPPDREDSVGTSRAEPSHNIPKTSFAPYDANEPILRHAKPRASYIEIDDLDIDEVDETEAAPQISPTLAAMEAHGPAVDKPHKDIHANEEVQGLNSAEEQRPSRATQEAAGEVAPKRRGRPPRKLPRTASPVTAEDVTPQIESGSNKKARGRPRKSLPTSLMEADTGPQDDMVFAPDTETRESNSPELDEQTNTRDGDFVEDSRQRRWRSRSSGVAKLGVGNPRREHQTKTSRESQVEDEEGDALPKRRRGRPPKSVASSRSRSSLDVILPSSSQFMSMAERMALKGKSFKIGLRKPQGNVKGPSLGQQTMTPVGERLAEKQVSKRAPEMDEGYEEHEEGGSESPYGNDKAPGRTGRNRKTSKARIWSRSSSSRESTDDEDIPSHGRITRGTRR